MKGITKKSFIKARDVLESLEEKLLAPYAKKSSRAERLIKIGSEGRIFDYRTEYQRDRDRIIYSRAFRRLRNKARIYRASDKDHFRDAFAHTIEVSQLARTIGRVLRLNEDLIEAISLGHDLGLPPFGEVGEKTFDFILSKAFAKDLKIKGRVALEGFQKHKQSLRIVDLLEKRYEYNGINLTHDTREGILKQGTWRRKAEGIPLVKKGLNLSIAPSFESQCVYIADRIAVCLENLDDGLRSGGMSIKEVEQLFIVRELVKKVGAKYTSLKNKYMRMNSLNRGLTHLLVTNVIHHSSHALKAWAEKNRIMSTEKFYDSLDKIEGTEIDFSKGVQELFQELTNFVSKKMANSSYTKRLEAKAYYIISELFKAFYFDPLLMEDYLLLRYKEWNKLKFLRDIPEEEVKKEISQNYHGKSSFVWLICDHIAGMTDSYAVQEFHKLSRLEYRA